MKTITTMLLALFIIAGLSTAQDTLYVYKAGAVIFKQSVTGVDSLTFKKNYPMTVTDIDGNVYKTVTIGTQIWMAENLKVTKYRDGSSIPNETSNTVWASLASGAYCDYNNDTNHSQTYGRLYNWYTINDSRRISPIGWHIPSHSEWTILENYLTANGYNFDGTTNTNKIAKSLASNTSDWTISNIVGSVGNNLSLNNKSGFSGLPSGNRDEYGVFSSYRLNGPFWTSSKSTSTTAWYRDFINTYIGLGQSPQDLKFGFSIRCIKD